MRYLYVLILFFTSGYTLSQARVETSEINIFFENNSSSLSDKAKHEIAQLSNKIIKENNSSFSLEIIGFTDSIGSEKSNKRLSEARAKAVYNEFMSHANSEEGIQQTIISDWFPSSCYDHMYDTSEFVVPIKYHGDGIYLNEGKPTRYQSKNLSGFRRGCNQDRRAHT